MYLGTDSVDQVPAWIYSPKTLFRNSTCGVLLFIFLFLANELTLSSKQLEHLARAREMSLNRNARVGKKRLRAAYNRLGYWASGEQTIKRWHHIAWTQNYDFSDPRLPILRFDKFPNLENVESVGCDQLGPLGSDQIRDASQASRVASELLFAEDGGGNFRALVRTGSTFRHYPHYSMGRLK